MDPGINNLLVCAAAISAGLTIGPSFGLLSVVLWGLFVYDYMMTVVVSGSFFAVCHSEMCGALSVIEEYRLPMALRFGATSALGLGDLAVGAVVVSFAMQRYGMAAVLTAAAYGVGIFLAIFWSASETKPVPALVPIVPCVWMVLAVFEIRLFLLSRYELSNVDEQERRPLKLPTEK